MKRFLSILLAVMLLMVPAFAEEDAAAPEDDGMLRVYLTSLGDIDAIHLTAQGNYAVESDAGFYFEDGAGITLSAQDDGVWLSMSGLHLHLGDSVTLTRHTEDGGLIIEEASTDNVYQGDLTITVSDDGYLVPILEIYIEDYLKGVVAYEMSDSFPIEALKAQAVAARTYALTKKYASGGRDYDLVDTTSDQVFRGYCADYANVISAVDETCGIVGLVDGYPAACYYTASNGGEIARPQDVWDTDGVDYIELKADPYDLENPASAENSLTFSADLSDCEALCDMIADRLSANQTFSSILSITPADADPEESIRYTSLQFEVEVTRNLTFFGIRLPLHTTGTVTVTLDVYDDIKDGLSLGLNGGDYELIYVTQDDDTFTLTMRRFGHGIGMSQRGAQWMASEYDMTYDEILAFYYPGMTFTAIEWDAPAIEALDVVTDGAARPDPTPSPTPAPLPEAEDGEVVAVVTLSDTSSTLNLRAQPSTSAMVVCALANGQEVLVSGEADDDGWVYVRTAEAEGYVKYEYLTFEEEAD